MQSKNPCPWCQDVWEQRGLFEWFVLLRLILGVAQVQVRVPEFLPAGEEKVTPVAELCVSLPHSAVHAPTPTPTGNVMWEHGAGGGQELEWVSLSHSLSIFLCCHTPASGSGSQVRGGDGQLLSISFCVILQKGQISGCGAAPAPKESRRMVSSQARMEEGLSDPSQKALALGSGR